MLFLDDLQWADMATLRLLARMLDDPGLDHLLVIASHRDDEVDETHPLSTTLRQVSDRHPEAVTHIVLGPLARGDLVRWLADTLGRGPEDCAYLAEVVERKTAGNPLAVDQFLRALRRERALVFDHDVGGWRWDEATVQSFAITDNVVEMVLDRLGRLPAGTRRALALAASLGHSFDLESLAMVSGERPEVLQRKLAPALDDGLLRPGREAALAFSHDRVEQAVYALVADTDRAAVHAGIAGSLLDGLPPRECTHRSFEIAEHLLLGADAIPAGPVHRPRCSARDSTSSR